MNHLHINVVNKVASYLKRDGAIVCGNSDYQILFTFDSEWETYTEKTARFIVNGTYTDVDFQGNTCPVPIIRNASQIEVGVYAGNLTTTTSAVIPALLSVLCGGEPPTPENDKNYANEAKEAADRAEAAAERAATHVPKDGKEGKSAYQYAQDGGYSGTESQFAEDINPDNIKSVVAKDVIPVVAQDIIAQLKGLPVFGIVDENKTITVTSQLSDGTYTLKYENDDGTTTDIGTITIGTENPIYEVDLATIGYTDDARWSLSDGTIRTGASGHTAINLIPFTRPSNKTLVMELTGIKWVGSSSTYNALIACVDGGFLASGAIYFRESTDNSASSGIKTTCHDDNSVTIEISSGNWNGIKLCGQGSGADAKITYTFV